MIGKCESFVKYLKDVDIWVTGVKTSVVQDARCYWARNSDLGTWNAGCSASGSSYIATNSRLRDYTYDPASGYYYGLMFQNAVGTDYVIRATALDGTWDAISPQPAATGIFINYLPWFDSLVVQEQAFTGGTHARASSNMDFSSATSPTPTATVWNAVPVAPPTLQPAASGDPLMDYESDTLWLPMWGGAGAGRGVWELVNNTGTLEYERAYAPTPSTDEYYRISKMYCTLSDITTAPTKAPTESPTPSPTVGTDYLSFFMGDSFAASAHGPKETCNSLCDAAAENPGDCVTDSWCITSWSDLDLIDFPTEYGFDGTLEVYHANGVIAAPTFNGAVGTSTPNTASLDNPIRFNTNPFAVSMTGNAAQVGLWGGNSLSCNDFTSDSAAVTYSRGRTANTNADWLGFGSIACNNPLPMTCMCGRAGTP